jgi:hypothetical protein
MMAADTKACKIGQRTMTGKDKSGWQTTMALGIRLMKPTGQQSCDKIKISSLLEKVFFSNTVCPVEKIAPTKIIKVTF